MKNRFGSVFIFGLAVILLGVVSFVFILRNPESSIVSPSHSPEVAKSSASQFFPETDATPSSMPESSSSLRSQTNSGTVLIYQYNTKGQLQSIAYPDGSVYA